MLAAPHSSNDYTRARQSVVKVDNTSEVLEDRVRVTSWALFFYVFLFP